MRRVSNPWCGALVAVTVGCVGAPPAESNLEQTGALEALSSRELVAGKLQAVNGAVIEGTNDFALTLTPERSDSATTLVGFSALMPAHGHRVTASRIETSNDGYHIVGLSLSMSGVWRLTGELEVEGAADAISFDVDVP